MNSPARPKANQETRETTPFPNNFSAPVTVSAYFLYSNKELTNSPTHPGTKAIVIIKEIKPITVKPNITLIHKFRSQY